MYELEDGELIPMTAESEINRRIAMFILVCFVQQLGIPPYRLSMKTEIVTGGSRVRETDLVVFSEDLAKAMEGAKRSTEMQEMPPPLLVVEVVSPNQSSRNYRYKRSEYGARGMPEYWEESNSSCIALFMSMRYRVLSREQGAGSREQGGGGNTLKCTLAE